MLPSQRVPQLGESEDNCRPRQYAPAPINVAEQQHPEIMGRLHVPAQELSVFGQRIVYYEA